MQPGLPRMNCMIRQGESSWMPAIKMVDGSFTDYQGLRLAEPSEVRDATPEQIDAEMAARGEVFIGGQLDSGFRFHDPRKRATS